MRDEIHLIARFAYWYGLAMFLVLFFAMAVMPELRTPALIAAGLCCVGSIVCGYCRAADKIDARLARRARARGIDRHRAPHIPASRPGADITRVVLAGEYRKPGGRQ